jgi:DNA-binding CsgD family transcriptional regulator
MPDAFVDSPKDVEGNFARETIVNITIVSETSENCPHCGQGLRGVGTEPFDGENKDSMDNGPAVVVRRELSFREKQVVNLIKQAKANKEIAYELRLTEGTIKEYLFTIFKKIGVKNRTELALWATENLAA